MAEPYSELEVAPHEQKEPLLKAGDQAADAPERDLSGDAPELDKKSWAPQVSCNALLPRKFGLLLSRLPEPPRDYRLQAQNQRLCTRTRSV